MKYTSLVGIKWKKSTLLKCLWKMYTKTVLELMDNTKISDEERLERYNNLFKMFHSIYDPIRKYGVTVKKK